MLSVHPERASEASPARAAAAPRAAATHHAGTLLTGAHSAALLAGAGARIELHATRHRAGSATTDASALGADRSQVLGMILKQGLRLAAAGITVGVVGAFGLTRLMQTLLYQVRPSDPLTFVSVPLGLIGVAIIASCIPGLRATRVSPSTALRME